MCFLKNFVINSKEIKFWTIGAKSTLSYAKTELKMSIKFAWKPHLIFMVKIKGLEAIFSENVILLKGREIEMLQLCYRPWQIDNDLL